MVQSARDGGSQLRQAQKCGILQIWENCQVQQIQWQGPEWRILCREGTSLQVDRIWLATGYRFDVSEDPLWQDLQQQPTARNLSGARSASERIVPSLVHPPYLAAC